MFSAEWSRSYHKWLIYQIHILEIDIYCFYGKIYWGHVVCQLYGPGGGLYLEESILRGSWTTGRHFDSSALYRYTFV